jgi:hypothetical protein
MCFSRGVLHEGTSTAKSKEDVGISSASDTTLREGRVVLEVFLDLGEIID